MTFVIFSPLPVFQLPPMLVFTKPFESSSPLLVFPIQPYANCRTRTRRRLVL